MAISDNYVPVKVIGNGVTTQFSGNWNIIAQGYERVYLEDAVTGVQTLQVITTNYTLSFDGSGFTVTMNVAPTSANYVVIGREVADDQTVPFKTSQGFQGAVEENAFDKLTAITQDTKEQLSRAAVFPLGTDPAIQAILPLPLDQAPLIWNGSTGLLENGPPLDDIDIIVDNLTSIITVADNIADVNTNATNIASINTNAANIVAIQGASANATIAQNASNSAVAAVLAVANQWAFDTSTSMANPTTGKIRANNAALASATQIAISSTSNDAGNPNINAFLATWANSTHTPNGIIRIEKNASNFVILGVNGALTNNTTWLQIPVSYIGGAGSFSASDTLFISFAASGNDGISPTSANTFLANATTGTATPTGIALSASQLAGRGASGNIAAITLGTNLSMSGTTLNVTGVSTQFTSSQQTITAGGALTIAHGLGVVPTLLSCWLVCQTGDSGFSAGDILMVNPGITTNTSAIGGHSATLDSTNINIRFGSDANTYRGIANKGTGAASSLTNANWKVVFHVRS